MLLWQPVIVTLCLLARAQGQASSASLYEGSPCKMADGSRGQCIPMTQCPSALALFKKDRRNFRPKRCGFSGFVEIICCADVPLRRAEEACRDFTNEINPSINVYIYGGSVAEKGEFPHMVGTDDFAEPFDAPSDLPVFRSLSRGPPLSRVPPPGAPPPRPLALTLDDDVTTDGTLDSTTGPDDSVQAGEAGETGEAVGARFGILKGIREGIREGIRGAVHRHQERVDHLHRHLQNLFPGHRDDTRPPHDERHPSHDNLGNHDQYHANPTLDRYPDHPPREREPENPAFVNPNNRPPYDRNPANPNHPPPVETHPRPPRVDAPTTTAFPDDYGALIDPRSGDGGRERESFGQFEEETTSRPRLVRVNASTGFTGKEGRPGNWRVPPDSVWARPPSTARPHSTTPVPDSDGAVDPSIPLGSPPASSEGKVGEDLGGISLYVIGGDEALKEEFRHMVALGYRDRGSSSIKWDCGGSLISREHVLTAAHCVTNSFKGKPVSVRVGAHNLTDADGEQRAVLQVSVHPDYSTKSHYNDLAVLRIEAVRFSERVQPACLYSRPRAPDSGMLATGWGVTDIDR
ncbi:uncharacterized protein LOC117641420 isoform X2 [Thrips palmi]|uniref:Uncharacterized protein LOC117641420 isoform X2 n=1 Tax=Thrips palmi TaxID=161013 RepID=A0A6P8YKV2_THRPL|nr:uncharacterized protein LOC117641420 isoform X2 [Thrips palmi]